MLLEEGQIYHIYNRGNNRQTIFFKPENYLYFLGKFRKYLSPQCDLLAYTLMPNHFHFLIHATEGSAKSKPVGNINLSELSNGFRLLQSNYAQHFNKKYNRSGSLFRQKIKMKSLSGGDANYGFVAFHYIHQNPLKAGLATRIEDWKYSSFPDHAGIRMGTICNKKLAFKNIGFDRDNFVEGSYRAIEDVLIQKIF